jgi:phospholipid N-methyltransferase
VDLFKEQGWVCELPAEGIRAGSSKLFYDTDDRPQMVVDVCGSINGFNILELGPLEGAHTFQLIRRGAGSVLSIEASPEFYLKCLNTKEILGLSNARYLLGDFNAFLERDGSRYDLVFACGVLYHMTDPIHTLYLISKATSRIFSWSHYILESTPPESPQVERHGFRCHYFKHSYPEYHRGRSWSGLMPFCNRLYLKDIIGALEYFGFDNVAITEDDVTHQNGPAVSLVAQKTDLSASPREETNDR